MSSKAQPGFSTRAIHEGYRSQDAFGALSPPVFLTSTFAFDSIEQAEATFSGECDRFVYGRVHNPTQSVLESRLASLEGGEASIVTASGMGAIASLLWTLLRAGDELVAHQRMYGNSFTLISEALPKFGVKVALIDLAEPSALAARITAKTKVVFFECPANPQLELMDIRAISAIASKVGALTVVDSTLASPYLLRPLEYGADVVVHSATKYLSGHGDVLGGVVTGSTELIKTVRTRGLRYMTGATLSPMSAFLILRGLKTLGLRMDRHSSSALAMARFLNSDRRVRRVFYPGLENRSPDTLPVVQISTGGGLLSFELNGGREAAFRFMNALRLVKIAVSLGDAETLVQHPATMTHAAYATAGLESFGLSDRLLRLSVGLEDSEDLIDDVSQALHGL